MNGDNSQIIGSIGMFGGTFAVLKYTYCEGQLMSIEQNQALFSILGNNYGGDARTTFGIPDLRGRVATGLGAGPGLDPSYSQGLGQMGGKDNFVMTTDQMPPHTHTFSYSESSPGESTLCTGSLAVAKDGTDAGSASSGSHLSAGPIKAGSFSVSNLYKDGATAFENLDVKVSCSGGGNIDPTKVTIGTTGASSPIPLHQPYTVINYEIAIEGLYPSRN